MKLRIPGVVLMGLCSLAFLSACHTQGPLIDAPHQRDVDIDIGKRWGLRKLDPKDYPDMRSAFMQRDGLERAVDKSIQYLNAASSVHAYPSGQIGDTITHGQVLGTLREFKGLLHAPITPDQFQQEVLNRYDVYTSIGFDDEGSVWFTGYFTPIYHGSRTATAEYRYPVYQRPKDLKSNEITGEVYGREVGPGQVAPYPTRAEIMQSGMLRGTELLWFKDPMEPYIIQIQGSAKVILPDNTEAMIGYAGKNGREYRGLGSELVKDGKIDKKHLSLPAVLEYFKAHPEEREGYMMRNESFAFLKEYKPEEWPSGSLGVQVTAQRSLATDKKIFPRASLTFVSVDKPTADGNGIEAYRGFNLDQDTGGAIRAPGRADMYMGIGEEAGRQAGREFAQGRLYYIFLKPGQFDEAALDHPALKSPSKVSPRHGAAGGTSPAKSTGGPVRTTPTGDGDIFPGATPGK